MPALVAFHRALYLDEPARFLSQELVEHYAYRDMDELVAHDIHGLLVDGVSTVLIAELEGVPAGYIIGHVEDDPRRVLPRVGLVTDWLIVERERHRGIGRQLMESLTSVFVRLGCDAVESRTYAANRGALRAHAALGFCEVEIRMRRSCARPLPTDARACR